MNDEKKDPMIVSSLKNKIGEFVLPKRLREDIYYSNIVSVTSTIFDVRYDFGRRAVHQDMAHDADVTVMMSPQHAKELLVIMIKTLAEYEQRYGIIPSEYEVNATVRPKRREEDKLLSDIKIDDFN